MKIHGYEAKFIVTWGTGTLPIDLSVIMHVGQNEESRSSGIMEKQGSREVGESPKCVFP